MQSVGTLGLSGPRAIQRLLLMVALVAPSAAGAVSSFTALGALPATVPASIANAVSADGSTAVGASSTAAGAEAFVWSAGPGIASLGTLGGPFSEAKNLSADGSVVVGWAEGVTQVAQAFRWTQAGGMSGLGFLPGGSVDSAAHDIVPDGSIIVGQSDRGLNISEAFTWTSAGGMVGLGLLAPLSDNFSVADAVSDDGSVVVGWSGGFFDNSFQAFKWTSGGGMVGLPFLPGGDFSRATDVSADGSVIVGTSDSDPDLNFILLQAVRWSGGSVTPLGSLSGGSLNTVANGVSSDGAIVVGRSFSNASFSNVAFIWDAQGGLRALQGVLEADGVDLTGWALHSATGVSSDGATISGWGVNPSGQTEAWIATVPEPGRALLSAGALLGLLSLARIASARKQRQTPARP